MNDEATPGSIDRLSIDVEQLLFDVEQILFDVEQLLFDVEQLLFDVERLLFDVEQLLFDVEQFSFDVEQLLSGVEQLSFDVEQLLFDVEQLLFDVDQLLIPFDRLVIDVDLVLTHKDGWSRFCLRLEQFARELRLPDDGLESPYPQFLMIWNRNRDRRRAGPFLHHDVTAATADLAEAVRCENRADLRAGEDAELTQPRPPGP